MYVFENDKIKKVLLKEISKNKIKNIMNRSILEFFNYSLKDKKFDTTILDKYKEDIEVSYDIN